MPGEAGTAVVVAFAAWQALQPEERDAVRAIAIDARQVEFAGTTAAAIAACEAADPATIQGLALRVQDAIVGFVVLRRGPAAPAWAPAGAAVLGGLRVDASWQGRGIGTAAMLAVRDWLRVHWPECARLVLRVDDDNAAAIRAYEKAGWAEFGERRLGRVGLERTLGLALG
jgi:RimJ/RimL family protein N-acetyltransferase